MDFSESTHFDASTQTDEFEYLVGSVAPAFKPFDVDELFTIFSHNNCFSSNLSLCNSKMSTFNHLSRICNDFYNLDNVQRLLYLVSQL